MTRMPRYLELEESDLPETLGEPAEHALCGAGISCLKDLATFSERQVRQLHGIGPNALGKLRTALTQRGLSFATTNILQEQMS
jgi:hypothetical protein